MYQGQILVFLSEFLEKRATWICHKLSKNASGSSSIKPIVDAFFATPTTLGTIVSGPGRPSNIDRSILNLVIEDNFKRQITRSLVILPVCPLEEKGGDILIMRKDLLVAVLASLCLTATLLIIIPIRSSSGTGEYDAWVDTNEDGKINILDISTMAKAYGTSGDPTKQVVISGYSNVENLTSFVLLNQTLMNVTIATTGYRRITLSLYAESKDAHKFEIFWGYKIADKFAYSTTPTLTSESSIHLVRPVWYQNVRSPIYALSLDVTFSEFWLSINNNSTDYSLTGWVVYSLNT